MSAASDVILRGTRQTFPSNPNFHCPFVSVACGGACDFWLCVGSGEMRINSDTPCTVAVAPDLYR